MVAFADAAGANFSAGAVPVDTDGITPIGTGDLLIAAFFLNQNRVVNSVPSGWTLIRRTQNGSDAAILYSYYKIAGASEAGPYSFGLDATSGGSWIIARYTAPNSSNPINVSDHLAVAANATTAIDCPSVDPTTLGVLVCIYAPRVTGSFTPPSGMTERVEITGSSASSISMSDVTLANADPTGTKTATRSSVSSVGECGQSIALANANSNPNTPTNLARTGSQTDTTPTFSADISDPDSSQQIKARFEVFLSAVSQGTVDSSLTSGSHTATAEFPSGLAVGTYTVKAKTVDDIGAESAQTGDVSFKVTTYVTKDMTALWNINAGVQKDLTALWNVIANNIIDLVLRWNIVTEYYEDLVLLWKVKTPWVRVTETADNWVKVAD